MSDSKTSPSNGARETVKRSLPSWKGSRANVGKSHGTKPTDDGTDEESTEVEAPKLVKGCGNTCTGINPSEKNESRGKSFVVSLGAPSFSELLEGVVFALSGFVNPERSVLRSQALEMGAEYKPDWNSDCTLLVCAFPNTPKFRQVEADCGTIVSKEWILECYKQKTLVEIESYLMHAGKPWRRQISLGPSNDLEPSTSRKPLKKVERVSHSKLNTSAPSESGVSNPTKDCFPPTEVKKWAIDDWTKTVSWLESQEVKPEPSEIKKIAAEGILTCLQDAIDSLEQEQDIQQITEQWKFVPRVVEELARLEGTGNGSASLPKKDLYRQAMACKQIYEVELHNLDDDLLVKKKKPKTEESQRGDNRRNEVLHSDAVTYDSDETIEMTEQEIDQAYNTVVSKLYQC